ncbi:uncharacterized protein MYCFIDRAFT_213520 [Pseudocercospora fijiensis CIRAD86]|uniref:SWR1-complex protein 3 domain-containing protein n=1 Tax=Pseudocercospora fijiensis (strain CIRAD86) TaxID=383855 RepID=N1QCA2_PSEFD|nr:uncharacterized protein MYCFIDRAFT_213520 [Pseudocercospora fijiensis CIRAD86]EME89082.1 hypothetical protein MYCFIDRAFT_213520 [Pseudocercospora fijiensis CIRAD86]
METGQEAKVGEKRRPGRPPKTASAPPAKRQRTSISTPPTNAASAAHTPAIGSPVPEKRVVRLPAKINENKPLPTLPEPQPQTLSNEEYQSIAASAVLATSLEKSRSRWMCDGILERYWVKPEKGTGKNAKPPPPNNPDLKTMKMRGECRIRIEPHLFVANFYTVENNALPPKNKQPVASQPRQQQPIQQFQARPPLSSASYQGHRLGPLPPVQSSSRLPPAPQPGPSRAQASPAPGLSGQKASPDPVISMLATRASSDPELKSLMKEVATGNANQDQLKIFQKHIDELTTIIAHQKKTQEEAPFKPQQQSNMIQYDGPSDSRPVHTPQPIQPHPQHAGPQARPQSFVAQPQSTPPYGQQQPWTAPAAAPVATNSPVILEFTGSGATEDRFLFPEYSILEALSPQHLLVSFILTRKGRDAVDPTGLEPDQEYWQPITMMIEVAYGREELLNCIRRWVKPADDVRKNMQETMERCQRVSNAYLALRLPFKGSTTTDSENVSKDVTPIVEEKVKPKPAPKRKAPVASTPKSVEAEKAQKEAVPPSDNAKLAATPRPAEASSAAESKDAISTPTGFVAAETPTAVEGGRPKRAVRKSVRISEG